MTLFTTIVRCSRRRANLPIAQDLKEFTDLVVAKHAAQRAKKRKLVIISGSRG